MKKIININLGGRAIPIEESAYEALKKYIESLRKLFAKEEGVDEIINDIESRISELMSDRLRQGAACMTDADMADIISAMGRPEDVEKGSMDGDTADAAANTTDSPSKNENKFYRNEVDKVLGGVCSGLGNYFKIDISIIRVLFVIVTIAVFGLGLLAYILLWALTPAKVMDGMNYRKMFRNPKDRIIGGVAGGMAAYFNRDSKIIRIIFLAPFLLGLFFSFLFKGFLGLDNLLPNFVVNVPFHAFISPLYFAFIIVYIVLWAVLPVAKSEYEIMEMEGQQVDINTISQNVIGSRAKENSNAATESKEVEDDGQVKFSAAGQSYSQHGSANAGQGKGNIIGDFFRIIIKLILIGIAATLLFALFSGIIALITGSVFWWPLKNFAWSNTWQMLLVLGSILFFIVTPVVGVIVWIIRRLAKIRTEKHYLGWTFGMLWFLGWVSAILLAATITQELGVREVTEQAYGNIKSNDDKIVFTIGGPQLKYTGSYTWLNDNDDDNGWNFTADSLQLSDVRFTIVKSYNDSFKATLRKFSLGKNVPAAMERAENLHFPVEVHGNVITLPAWYTIYKKDKYRGQRVELEVAIPVGKKIVFDETFKSSLQDARIEVRRDEHNNWHESYNIYDHWDYKYDETRLAVSEFVMQPNGILKRIGDKTPKRIEEEIENSLDEAIDNKITDSLKKLEEKMRLEERLKEQKRKQEELEQQIKELSKANAQNV